MIQQSISSMALVAVAASLFVATSGTASAADDEKQSDAIAAFSPDAGKDYPMRPLFGDTYLQTSRSFDALE
jgi:hypothetical protein